MVRYITGFLVNFDEIRYCVWGCNRYWCQLLLVWREGFVVNPLKLKKREKFRESHQNILSCVKFGLSEKHTKFEKIVLMVWMFTREMCKAWGSLCKFLCALQKVRTLFYHKSNFSIFIGGFPCKPAESKLLQKILSKNIFNKYLQRVSSKNPSKKSLVARPLFSHLDSKKFSLKLCWQIFRQFAFNNY